MASGLSTRGVQPRSKQTSANKLKVQVLRDLPRVRGLWCSRPRKGSSSAVSRRGRALCGREDFSFKQARPSEWKAWMALRTDMAVQPRLRAIRSGDCPEALASRIWQRRRMKAEAERRPACRCERSAAVKVRTKMGLLIEHCSRAHLKRKDLY